MEAVGEQGAEHQLGVVGSSGARGFGVDVEAVGIEPGRPAEDVVVGDAVGIGDQIDQCGLADDQAVAGEVAATHEGLVAMRAEMDVGGFECLGNFGGDVRD